MQKTVVYLGLGGNIGDTFSMLQKAIKAIANLKNIDQLQISKFYQTSPVGNIDQDSFINAVCRFETNLDPKALLRHTQDIESFLGKTPKPKHAPRVIDIDIILYGSHCYQDQDLEIPHPHWAKRLFVLVPLSDLIEEVEVSTSQGTQRFVLKNLIQDLQQNSQQAVSLLDKKLLLD